MSLPLAEALLDTLLQRYRDASGTIPAAPGTLATVLVGPHSGRGSHLPVPRLTVTFGTTRRALATADEQVENRLLLELALDDAATGEESAMRLALRWAAWLEAVLVPECEQNAAHLTGLVQTIAPVDTGFEAGGPGLGEFTLTLRFLLTTTALLGAPYA